MNLSIRVKDDKNLTDDIKTYEPRRKICNKHDLMNQEWVQILINLRMKYSKCFTRKRHSATEAWMSIYREMVQLGAPEYITIEKIKKKWMNLIARYKHLKFSMHGNNTITWPYFEQIDRAFSRNPTIIELRKSTSMVKVESDSEEEKSSDYVAVMMKKKQFTNTLIQLRFDYRHLFTGKKYAAQKGWMVIQNKHPEGRLYTIEQLSKCWQNLVQRYRTLLESEPDHSKITWSHFHTIHEKMHKPSTELMDTHDMKQDENQIIELKEENESELAIPPSISNASLEQTNTIEKEIQNSLITKLESPLKLANLELELDDNKMLYDEENSCEDHKHEQLELEIERKESSCLNKSENGKKLQDGLLTISSNEIFKYMVKRDEKLDEHNERVMNVLERIATKLDNLKNGDF